MTNFDLGFALLIISLVFGFCYLLINRLPSGYHVLIDAMADMKLQLIQHERRIKELEGKEAQQ